MTPDEAVTETVRVLIADDDPIVRAVVAGMIESDPSLELVAQAGDTGEAIRLVLEHSPDVAVLDWMMPGGGGPQAAQQIRDKRPYTRIVALTSSDSGEASMDMMRAGAVSFLVKGASKEEIVGAIRDASRDGTQD